MVPILFHITIVKVTKKHPLKNIFSKLPNGGIYLVRHENRYLGLYYGSFLVVPHENIRLVHLYVQGHGLENPVQIPFIILGLLPIGWYVSQVTMRNMGPISIAHRDR